MAAMLLRRSAFAHLLPLGRNRSLILHAVSQLRVAVDDDASALFTAFSTPRRLPDDFAELCKRFGHDQRTLAGAIAALMERGFLTEQSPEQEAAALARELGEGGARDPGDLIDKYRRGRRDGALDYWAARETRKLGDLAAPAWRLNVALIGDCDVQMEAEYLRIEARRRGIDLHVGATFPDDLALVAERPFDAILVGASRARGAVVEGRIEDTIEDVRRTLRDLRGRSIAPILVDNLPEPTVQPLGLAERGANGHRNRVRAANLALSELVEGFVDVHVVDVAHAFGREGSGALIDDGLVGFTHFGSPGWLLQRPESEKAAVHGLAPEPESVIALVGGDPTRRERVAARAHIDALMTVLAIDAKKVVVVDLDGVLWPGVLAETGAPFAWTPEVSGPYSHIGVYFGLHEALKTLKRRGVLLAAASKNDEAVVRELWRYPDHYPRERLLTPEDFETLRIGWGDKPNALRDIAAELGFSLSALVFIDDSVIEREVVRAAMPEVEVWGEDIYDLRRRLLDDPRLQSPRVTAEAARRGELVKAGASRERLRAEFSDVSAFRASLEIVCEVFPARAHDFPRIVELFQRTTQFNATAARFSAAELAASSVFAMRVKDRFVDHGLVGAAVVVDNEILGFAMSCRVIGLGVEQRLLDAVVASQTALCARIVESSRNGPVRNLYRDRGFAKGEDGFWRMAAKRVAA